MPVTLSNLNAMGRNAFVAVCGPFFEHSPWIAEVTWSRRPFLSRQDLHAALCMALAHGTADQKLTLIQAHPDLVGRLAREGRLTSESTTEQAAAGLIRLSKDEAEQFDRLNAAYREKFGFPFIICARENKKQAILDAFPRRLKQARNPEIMTALLEIEKIARLRLQDAITE